MQIKHRSLKLVWILILILSLTLAACTPTTPAVETTDEAAGTGEAATEEAEDEETTIRIAVATTVATLDPIKSVAAGDISTLGQLYSRLLRVTPQGELEGGLAETWEVSDDNRTYTFHLREAQFSDGSPVTAQDVVFSFLRLRDQEDSAYSGAFQVIESVEATDERTVVFTLDAPAGTYPGAFEMFNAGIVPQAAVESMGDEAFGQNPVTSGPYMLREWRPNDRLILERNPYYWREGYPKIDVVEFIEVPSDNTRVSMLRAGEVDGIGSAPWVNIEEMKSEEGIVVPLNPSSVINIMLINHQREKFQDLRVRQAMAKAIDVESVVNAVTFGNGTVANSLIPNTLLHYNPNLPGIEYDPDEARSLLEEANAVGTEIELLTVAGSSGGEQMNQLIQDQLEVVGFEVSITEVDLGTWWERIPGADYDATVTWWYNETPDPDLAVRWALCGDPDNCGSDSFFSFYNNERINELTELGLREPDPEKRREIYYEIQQIALDEVAQIPLYYQPYSIATRDYVENLMMTPALQWTLEEATINR